MRCIAGAVAATSAIILAGGLAGGEPQPETAVRSGAALARSLAAAERHFGATSPALLPMLASLAQFRFEQAQLEQATALRRRSLKIALAAYGGDSTEAAVAMASLARLYIELGHFLDAEPLAIAATQILEERLGPRAPELASVLAERARLALAWGEDGPALDFARRAVAVDRPADDAAAGAPMRALGAVLTAEARFDDSERSLRQALALDRAAGDRLAAARDLARLAEAYLRQKRHAAALPPIEEAAAIDQEHLAASHPLIAEDFDTIGRIYLETDRTGDAARILQAAVALLEGGPGANTPTLAYVELDLARAEHALGHEQKSQALFTAAQHILNAAQDAERDRQRQT